NRRRPAPRGASVVSGAPLPFSPDGVYSRHPGCETEPRVWPPQNQPSSSGRRRGAPPPGAAQRRRPEPGAAGGRRLEGLTARSAKTRTQRSAQEEQAVGKTFSVPLTACLLALPVHQARAQGDARAIVEKAIKAQGGEAKVAKLRMVRINVE